MRISDWSSDVCSSDLLLAAPVLRPMVAWLPTRRRGISGFLWIATFGTHGRAAMDSLIDRYVDANTADIRKRLLPAALKVLHRHRRRGDRVLVATGAPPELARATLEDRKSTRLNSSH